MFRRPPSVVCVFAAGLLLFGMGCGRTETRADAPPEEEEPLPVVPPIGPAEELDVLLVVDNGFTGGPAQQTLSATVPYMVDRLVNPRCVNGRGQIVDNPGGPDAPCAVGRRDFASQTDVRLAVISSSIGGHGADTCSPADPDFAPSQDDGAGLLSRDADGGVVATYDGRGFLAWDPDARQSPPGESGQANFAASIRDVVDGTGTEGCRYPAPLEAAYRFLVDPEPPVAVRVVDGQARREGVDTSLLEQRASFLRPDSAVLVVFVSDRDDCSIRDEGTFFFAAQARRNGEVFRLPPPRAECEIDPNDPCCRSCGEAQAGCPADPRCDEGSALSAAEDPLALRCFEQKRRFGVDFNYPIERYLEGFRSLEIADATGQLVTNPLFAAGRRFERVAVAALTGVPWPDVAIAPNDLSRGLQPATETPWERLLPQDDGSPPTDPLMVGSRGPRTGANPVTGDALAPPQAPPLANPTNGHEHALVDAIQFSCIYPLPTPQNCAGGRCECGVAALRDTNPVCQDPDLGSYDELQRFGRATPAPRLLTLIRDLGPQGVLGTLCAGPEPNPAAADFGFKPSVDALLRAIRRQLVPFDDDLGSGRNDDARR
ncbi:MAG: hypothetical protein AAF928_10740 [Myxococcota bacterium]